MVIKIKPVVTESGRQCHFTYNHLAGFAMSWRILELPGNNYIVVNLIKGEDYFNLLYVGCCKTEDIEEQLPQLREEAQKKLEILNKE